MNEIVCLQYLVVRNLFLVTIILLGNHLETTVLSTCPRLFAFIKKMFLLNE